MSGIDHLQKYVCARIHTSNHQKLEIILNAIHSMQSHKLLCFVDRRVIFYNYTQVVFRNQSQMNQKYCGWLMFFLLFVVTSFVCAYNIIAFIYVRDDIVVAVIISFLIQLFQTKTKTKTKFKMQMQQTILNIERKLYESIHFNHINVNEFNVMKNNSLVNGFCTLELTLLVEEKEKKNTFSN